MRPWGMATPWPRPAPRRPGWAPANLRNLKGFLDAFKAEVAIAALKGPLHGGANEQVLRMINEIGSVKNVPKFIESVKSGEGGRLMGFGHRVYKSYDPRAKIVKKLADEVFKVVGVDKDLEIALELERIALQDDYFVKRKLYPNVDFYSASCYFTMGIPIDMFTPVFAVSRISGWAAHVIEQLDDNRLIRPRADYLGPDYPNPFIPIDQR